MESLLEISTQPWTLAVLLIGLAWLWEDASLIAGALLAVDQYLNVGLAILAVFIGITSGDLGLYYLGFAARKVRRIRAWILLNKRSRHLRKRFKKHVLLNILLIRFVPGLRTVGFTVCGLWDLSLARFCFAVVAAGLIWIGLIFPLVFVLGSASWFEGGYWKWGLMGIALALLIFNNTWPYLRTRYRN